MGSLNIQGRLRHVTEENVFLAETIDRSDRNLLADIHEETVERGQYG